MPADTHSSWRRTSMQSGISRNKPRGSAIDPSVWPYAAYKPTPTIVEAARALYARHSVHDIARHDAGAQNLHVTSKRVEDLIEQARSSARKLICFVTGVPGAGKTLVGLNIATHKRDQTKPTHAVFLSGNGPLVAVLQEALVRDDLLRRKQAGERLHQEETRKSDQGIHPKCASFS